MRKITAIFIVLALIMAVAVACDNGDDGTTTSASINTQYTPEIQTTTEALAQQSAQSGNNSAATYVLTTQADQTAPWVSTTRFEITQGTTVADSVSSPASVGSSDYDISFNVSEISKPNVNTSQASTMPKTTSDGQGNTNAAVETTADESAEAVSLIVNSYGYGDGIVYVEVDPSNWNGNFAAATQNITVKVNGVALGTTAACKVPSKKTGGVYEIKIDLSSQNIESGSVIDFTIPTGIVKNQSGSQYNLSYSASVTV